MVEQDCLVSPRLAVPARIVSDFPSAASSVGQKWGKPYATLCHFMPIYVPVPKVKMAINPHILRALVPFLVSTAAQLVYAVVMSGRRHL